MSSGWGVGDEDHGVDYPVNRTYVPAATEIEDELDGLPDPSPQRDGWSAMAPTAAAAPAQPMAQGGSWDDGHDIGIGDMGRSSDKDFNVYSNDTFVPAAAGQESQHSSAGAWDDAPIAFHDSGLSNQFVSGRMQTGGASTSAAEGQQLVQGQSSASPGAGEDAEGDQKMPWWARWSGLSFLSQYFDIDTPDVVWRCSNSVVGVMNPNFLEATQQSPDLYGPFWVTTTLVFVTAMAGNFESYLEYVRNGSKEDDKDDIDPWRVDISELSWSAFVFYFYVFGVGTGMFLLLKFAKVQDASLVKSWCLYGYAMTVFVPVALLSVVPLFWVRVLLVGTATLLSGGFLLRNFRAAIQDAYTSRALAIMAGAAALHVSLMMVLLFYFFKY